MLPIEPTFHLPRNNVMMSPYQKSLDYHKRGSDYHLWVIECPDNGVLVEGRQQQWYNLLRLLTSVEPMPSMPILPLMSFVWLLFHRMSVLLLESLVVGYLYQQQDDMGLVLTPFDSIPLPELYHLESHTKYQVVQKFVAWLYLILLL